jgi:hypothetical protein
LILEEGRALAAKQNNLALRDDFLQTSNECELVTNKLVNVDKQLEKSTRKNDIEDCKVLRNSLTKQLNENLGLISFKITKMLIEQVVDDFLDVNFPLKKLNEAIASSGSN